MKVIEVKHMTKDYGSQKGVFDISFAIEKGETVGFLGPNGSGKTTTMRQLMGFIRADQGEACLMGLDCFENASEIQRHLGYLPGEIAFMEEMNGLEFIHFIAEMKGIKDMSRAEELMAFLKLDANVKIRRMSKGMKQKLGIVVAFMQDSEILILDEPTSGLDPLMQMKFVELIRQEKKAGKTILMSSHIFEEVEHTCDRVIMIRQGHIVADKTMEEISKSRMKHVEIVFDDEQEALSFSLKYPLQRDGRRIILNTGMELNHLLSDISKYKISDVNIRSQSLEELFMYTFGGEA